MKRQSIYLGFSLLLCFAVALAIKFAQPTPVEFDSVESCTEYLKSKGFCCVRVADHEYSYLVISNTPLTLDEARTASMKPQSTEMPGIARARLFRHNYLPDCQNLRFWGKVYVFGDLDVINKIDPR